MNDRGIATSSRGAPGSVTSYFITGGICLSITNYLRFRIINHESHLHYRLAGTSLQRLGGTSSRFSWVAEHSDRAAEPCIDHSLGHIINLSFLPAGMQGQAGSAFPEGNRRKQDHGISLSEALGDLA